MKTLTTATQNDMIQGRVPPQAIDLEEAVLGAMMLEKDAINDAIDILTPESFYKDAHQKIYAAITSLFQRSEPIDLITVTEELKKNGDLDVVGGPFYITHLTSRVASAANVEYHARIVSQKYIARELIRVSNETLKEAFDETVDVFDLIDNTEQRIFKVSEGNVRKGPDEMPALLQQSIKLIEELRHKKGGLSGCPTGFTDLDRLTSGFQSSDLIILAARPGMGKTALMLSMARNMAVDHKKPVALFSLEMSSLQLVNRLIASETELDSTKLRKGELADYEWEQLNSKITPLTDAPLYIDDTPALNIFELRAKCRRLKAQYDIQCVVIDYLQLMTVGSSRDKSNREQEISLISRNVKSIAKELNVPIIALSQLNRSVETRSGEKRPQLSDLRESGAIEQDADMVMFIYRPEYYDLTEMDDGTSSQGIAELIIAKHRNGALDKIKLRFISKLAKFANLDNTPYNTNVPSEDSEEDDFSYTTKQSRLNDTDEGDVPEDEPQFPGA